MRNVALLTALVCAAPVWADDDADRAALTAGVDRLVAPGALPGSLAAVGERAFVVLSGRDGKGFAPLAAAARGGRGRAVAVGHEAFFGGANLAQPGNAAFARNVAAWVGGKPLDGLRVGLIGQDAALGKLLGEAGCAVTGVEAGELAAALPTLDVLWLDQASLDRTPAAVKATAAWLARGGGVVVAGPAWGWKQVTGGDLTVAHSGNRLLSPLGVVFTEGTLDGPFAAGGDLDALHAGRALDALERHVSGAAPLAADALARASATVAAGVGALPADDRRLAPRALALCRRAGGDAIPEPGQPVTRSQPFARLKAALDSQRMRGLAPEQVTAHPASASFPGAVPMGARRESRTVTIDTKVPEWHGTGLYAAPGEVVTVTVPAEAVGKGLSVRIGAHTDTLWQVDRWTRFPDVSLSRPLDAATVKVASAFGGAVFVDVPERSRLGEIAVKVSGAVAAPRFVRGKTTLTEWRESLRNAPAPWAELEGELVALSVPSSVVRDLDDPETLMVYWDEMMRRCYELYAAPVRHRPERYCVDRQISVGYMHSGYPIMTHDDVARAFVDLGVLRGADGNKCWGFYHEMGHNFQRPEWTWETFGEVTNNLFSLYGAEQLNGDMSGAHPAMKPAERLKRIREVAGAPGKDAYYQRDPWYPLTMFHMLRAAFGWEPFTKVFAEFRDLPAAQRPRTDAQKRDQFALRFSMAVGKDVTQFLEAWGVKLSDDARGETKNLPLWLPDGFTARPR